MVMDIVQTALSACEGIEFTDRPSCPSCGGEVQGYDTRKKQFAIILENEEERMIHVRVRRFYCKYCKTYCYADEPFYPDSRFGSPVIDLCRTFAATIPFCRTATHLCQLGIVIDRSSVRNYANRDFGKIQTVDIFNMQLPFSIISLSSLAARAGEGSGIEGSEVLAACGFPSAHRKAPQFSVEEKREQQYEKEEREKRQADRP